MDRKKIVFRQVCKYGIFAVSVFILYILQSAPGFLRIFGLKPVFIIPFCITLSMMDENWQTSIIYVLGGLLTDMSCGRVAGFFTIQLLIACVRGTVAVKFFLKPSRRNVCFFSAGAMAVMLSREFFISYILGGFSHLIFFYLKNVILHSAYSAVFSLLFYRFIDFINPRFVRFDAR